MHPAISFTPVCRARVLLLWLLFAVGAALYGSLTVDDPFAVEGARLVELEEPRGGGEMSGDGTPPALAALPLINGAVTPVLLAFLAETPPQVPRFALLGAVTRAPPA